MYWKKETLGKIQEISLKNLKNQIHDQIWTKHQGRTDHVWKVAVATPTGEGGGEVPKRLGGWEWGMGAGVSEKDLKMQILLKISLHNIAFQIKVKKNGLLSIYEWKCSLINRNFIQTLFRIIGLYLYKNIIINNYV